MLPPLANEREGAAEAGAEGEEGEEEARGRWREEEDEAAEEDLEARDRAAALVAAVRAMVCSARAPCAALAVAAALFIVCVVTALAVHMAEIDRGGVKSSAGGWAVSSAVTLRRCTSSSSRATNEQRATEKRNKRNTDTDRRCD